MLNIPAPHRSKSPTAAAGLEVILRRSPSDTSGTPCPHDRHDLPPYRPSSVAIPWHEARCTQVGRNDPGCMRRWCQCHSSIQVKSSGLTSFMYQGVCYWNKLPLEIKQCPSKDTFKYQVKCLLYNRLLAQETMMVN